MTELRITNTKVAVEEIQRAAAAKKCWPCGCLHSSLTAIDKAVPAHEQSVELGSALAKAKGRLEAVRYECLGCEVCYPALALNSIAETHDVKAEACATRDVEARSGWPPLPGDYVVRRYQAPAAICTLTDDTLAATLAKDSALDVAIVGTLYTENLGIERLVKNVIANPNIRFLIVCGADSQQKIGHMPGQSLVSLSANGLDERGHIVGANGKRPVLRNIGHEAVEHFRRVTKVVDMVGTADLTAIARTVENLASEKLGPCEPFEADHVIQPMRGYLPKRMVSDPAGYFIVYVDRQRRLLTLEHYMTDGVLGSIIEGKTAAELYVPAVERGLLSRLDHAAYLGKELARAERALTTGESYVQDSAPEREVTTSVGRNICTSNCEKGES